MTVRHMGMYLAIGWLLAVPAACNSDSDSGTDPVENDLQRLSVAMAPYRSLDAAVGAGYAATITPCWYFSGEGAMGYHQGNSALIDGTPSLLQPEALMYEPQADQSLQFVGVEYIVPVAAWQGSERPRLFNREFSRNDELGLYTLHVWIERDNPSGMFADWNPDVSCDDAEESEDRSVPASAQRGHGAAGHF